MGYAKDSKNGRYDNLLGALDNDRGGCSSVEAFIAADRSTAICWS